MHAKILLQQIVYDQLAQCRHTLQPLRTPTGTQVTCDAALQKADLLSSMMRQNILAYELIMSQTHTRNMAHTSATGVPGDAYKTGGLLDSSQARSALILCIGAAHTWTNAGLWG